VPFVAINAVAMHIRAHVKLPLQTAGRFVSSIYLPSSDRKMTLPDMGHTWLSASGRRKKAKASIPHGASLSFNLTSEIGSAEKFTLSFKRSQRISPVSKGPCASPVPLPM